jgi:amidase
VSELVYESARELARRIRARELSVREVMDAHLARIDAVNPGLNAVVTLCAEARSSGTSSPTSTP